MPPSPRVTVRLDPEKYEQLCESMGLKAPPPVRFNSNGGRIFGTYYPLTNSISVMHGQEFYEANRMRAVNAELVNTLLHELCHAWQQQEWEPGHYEKNVVRAEKDANDFAERHMHEWRGVIRVTRTTFHKRLPG